jgi:hypothetical protein
MLYQIGGYSYQDQKVEDIGSQVKNWIQIVAIAGQKSKKQALSPLYINQQK